MSDCGCEGSCPVCRIGEVDDHKCGRCGVEFCPKCHGITNGIESENVLPCKCEKNCNKCKDTGVIETGNNDFPCDCPAGDRALFNEAGVIGPVTGAEIRRHFLNSSPEPITIGSDPILASSLPGRN